MRPGSDLTFPPHDSFWIWPAVRRPPLAWESSDLGNKLSAMMVSNHQFRQEVYERLPSLDDGPARSIIEYAVAEAADADGAMMLVRQGATRNKSFRSTVLSMALRNLLVEQTPMGQSGMHELYSQPAPELRKELFYLALNGSPTEKRLAIECLRDIDELRDEYGRVTSEPRHPDISTGVSWPQLDSEDFHGYS